ncbi:MAG TPA: hypothetical protein VD769_07620 [Gaiellaceae bacterium]|nr:hypothetical protein [Gaiellaceae bacterium]
MTRSVGQALRRLALVTALVAGVAAITAGAASAGPVLVLGPTVTGGMASDEALAAIAAGHTVEIADNTQWAAKTAAEFDAYDALIMGDPTCAGAGGSAPNIAAAEANRTTWSPLIDGNIVIIGTDEVFHRSQGGLQLTNSAVAFAGAAAGKTGLMISLSCYYHDLSGVTHSIPVLDQFGTFTSVGVDCYNDAHIVATHPALGALTDANLSNWSCSVHNAFAAFPSSFLTLAIAENISGPYTQTYPDGTFGVPYILARGEGLVPIGGGCGEVRGDGRLSTNPEFRFVFYNVKQEEGKAPTGEISFTDLKNRRSKVKFVSTSIDTLAISGATATLMGSGLVNGAPVTYKVVGTDGSPDTFAVELSNGYTASGNVTSGRGVNIKPCDPTAPAPKLISLRGR